MDYLSLISVIETEYDDIKDLVLQDLVIYLMETYDANEEVANKVAKYYGYNE